MTQTSEDELLIELFVLLEDQSASFDHKVSNGRSSLGEIISTQIDKFRINFY